MLPFNFISGGQKGNAYKVNMSESFYISLPSYVVRFWEACFTPPHNCANGIAIYGKSSTNHG